ncbi:uncharacterized protein [Blastocystis hominis]|uniref:V-type proton ATPase subunit C n=1 Tax=Blastocystis hominis TaxID=12968 RepID=D8M3A6_BLAHO|nr:uncharacterized protein [Blastocystis hominis]CBK22379.2 unnamed protein product [Blastocystis hominis]|eukprot:XP_012896427.1 uncharacterized protein [Blastocystis hominis]
MSKSIDDPVLISVPSDLKSEGVIRGAIASSNSPYCSMKTFPIPNLGDCTLELLMHLSDEMVKMDSMLRQLIEKIAKTYHDMSLEGNYRKLTVDGRSLEKYLEDFHWDESRFPERNSIGEHKNLIQQDTRSVESELRKMLQKYQDVHSNVTALRRKRGANILTAPLSLILREEDVMKATNGMTLKEVFLSTDYLETVVIIISNTQEKEFLQSYAKLGSEEAGREVVVPESARRLVSDSEGYVLFSVVILKKFERAVQTACRENRYTMRLFNLEEMKESGATEMEERELAKFEVEERKLKSDLLQWCRPNYSELASEWVHLKALRVYVESILRYGLHTPTFSFVVFPKAKTVEKLFATLDGLFAELGGSVKAYGSLKEENLTISAIVGNESTNYNYACVSIEKLSE